MELSALGILFPDLSCAFADREVLIRAETLDRVQFSLEPLVLQKLFVVHLLNYIVYESVNQFRAQYLAHITLFPQLFRSIGRSLNKKFKNSDFNSDFSIIDNINLVRNLQMESSGKDCKIGNFYQQMNFRLQQRETTSRYFELQKIKNDEKKVKISTSWKVDQSLKYFAFIDYFKESICDIKGMQLWGFCRMLSKFVVSRNSNQCRIYHKKMLKKFKSIDEMIKTIQHEIPEFKEMTAVYERKLSMIFKNDEEFKEPQGQKMEPIPEVKEEELFLEYQNIQGDLSNQIPPEYLMHSKQAKDQEKIEAMRTDATVKEEKEDIRASRKQINESLFDGSKFNSSSLQNPVTIHFAPPFWSPFYSQVFPNSFPQGLSGQREAEWQECQDLFDAWTAKLSNLIKKND